MGRNALTRGLFGFALLAACTEPSTSESSAEAADISGGASGESGSAETEAPELCCGCLCHDPSWSCSQETCIDEAGKAATLGPEAGFLEVGGNAFSLGVPANDFTASTERVWYAFRPAQTDPESRPLLVFFNGGPGSATTSGLFAMNTGPKTVDTEAVPPRVVDNPHDWSSFANLLYIDMPGTGFSQPGDDLGSGSWHPEGEAATTLRVVLGFMERHPLLGGHVVPVGESYGGRRTMLMARLAGDTTNLRTGLPDSGFRDASLADQLDAFGTERFGRYIMIQGFIQTVDQLLDDDFECPGDIYACNREGGDLNRRFEACAEVLTEYDALSEALGVDAAGIEGLDLSGFVHHSALLLEIWPWREGRLSVQTFAELVRDTQWFATNAGQDGVVRMPQLVQLLDADYPNLVESAVVGAEGSGARPGTLQLRYTDGQERTIRYPHYADAGHAVSVYAPGQLHDDVRDWLAETADP